MTQIILLRQNQVLIRGRVKNMLTILYIILGFIILGVMSIFVSFLSQRYSNNKLRLQRESKDGIKSLYHENSSKNVDKVMSDATVILNNLGIELSVEEILGRTYKSE